MDKYDNSVLERLWKYVQKTETCWLWTGGKTQGYGALSVHGGPIAAHRLSYEIYIGLIPDRLYVLHHCDVRSCVCPAHLFLGTHLDNLRDMFQKRRHWMANVQPEDLPRGDDHWSRKHPEWRVHGERQGAAKLTEGQVREILQRFRAANRRHGIKTQLGREFGVSRHAITSIVTGNSWAHVHI